MKRAIIFTFLFLGCESLEKGEWKLLEIKDRPGGHPYVVECVTERENAEIDPYSHTWRIKVTFSRKMERASVEENTAVWETDGLKEGEYNLIREVPPQEIIWDYDDRVMFYTVNLSWGKWFVMKIKSNARDAYGNRIDGRVSYGARADDDFSDEPSDFYSLPFRVGGASTAIPLLKEGISTPIPYRLTYSPFIQRITLFHRESIEAFWNDNSYLSLDGMFGKGIIVYPESLSFSISFKIPSGRRMLAKTLSARLMEEGGKEEIPLFFRDDLSPDWKEFPDELSSFLTLQIKVCTTLKPSRIYRLEINTEERLTDELGIPFVDLNDDRDNIYSLFFATAPLPFSSPVPPSLTIFPLSPGRFTFAVPGGGLIHRVALEGIERKVSGGRIIAGEEHVSSPNQPHTPSLRTVIKSTGLSPLYFLDEIADENGLHHLDTDGDGIDGGKFRRFISSEVIPFLEDPTEPDDTIFQAYPLSLTSSCEIHERFLPAWDTDFFSFSLSLTSTTDILTQGRTDTAIALFRDGEKLKDDLDSGNSLPSCPDICDAGISTVLSPGNYYIQIVPQYPPRWDEWNPPSYRLIVCINP